MNRQRSRAFAVTSGLSACGLAAAVVLTGCGAGQVSQTAIQEPAVNGTNAIGGRSRVRGGAAQRAPACPADRRLRADRAAKPTCCSWQSTSRPRLPDRLVSITSDVGTVAVTGNPTLPPGGTLVVGAPDGQPSPLDASEGADTAAGRGHAEQADQQRPRRTTSRSRSSGPVRPPWQCRSLRARPRDATPRARWRPRATRAATASSLRVSVGADGYRH